MKALEKLDSHLKERITDLNKAKEQGHRIIGYTAGGYLPEELVLACDAIPLCYIQAGDNESLKNAGAYICRWFDPFWRSQVAFLTSGKDPYYTIADLIVIPITDNHTRTFSNTAGYYTHEKESFVYGVPHVKDNLSLEYYLQGINRLKNKLEEFTGKEINQSRLTESVQLCNRERELFRQLSQMRKSENIAVPSKDFIALNHSSYLADKRVMIEVLESYIEEVKNSAPRSNGASRILLTGSTLARGDSKVIEIIEESGGVVVMEEFAEGIRPYWNDVKLDGDLMTNLAQSYFMDRVCPGWFRPGTERLDFLIKLVEDYHAAGLVWYHLMYRESYKVESYFFPDMLKQKTGKKMLTLESEYDDAEIGTMKTRIETFITTIRS